MDYGNRKLRKEIVLIVCLILLLIPLACGAITGIIVANKKEAEAKYQTQVQVLDKKEETKTNGFLFIVFTTVKHKIVVSDKDGERYAFEVSESDYVKFDVDGFYNIEVVFEKAKYIEKLEIDKWEEESK